MADDKQNRQELEAIQDAKTEVNKSAETAVKADGAASKSFTEMLTSAEELLERAKAANSQMKSTREEAKKQSADMIGAQAVEKGTYLSIKDALEAVDAEEDIKSQLHVAEATNIAQNISAVSTAFENYATAFVGESDTLLDSFINSDTLKATGLAGLAGVLMGSYLNRDQEEDGQKSGFGDYLKDIYNKVTNKEDDLDEGVDEKRIDGDMPDESASAKTEDDGIVRTKDIPQSEEGNEYDKDSKDDIFNKTDAEMEEIMEEQIAGVEGKYGYDDRGFAKNAPAETPQYDDKGFKLSDAANDSANDIFAKEAEDAAEGGIPYKGAGYQAMMDIFKTLEAGAQAGKENENEGAENSGK